MGTSAHASGVTRQLLEALGKFASARLRQVGALRIHPKWEARATVCEQCALRVVRCGVSYCGNPRFQQIDRDPAIDGCGCPCRDKAKSPHEHCPVDSRYQAAEKHAAGCSCKWCERQGSQNSKFEERMTNEVRISKGNAQAVSNFEF